MKDLQMRAIDPFPEPKLTNLRTAASRGSSVASKLLTEAEAEEKSRRTLLLPAGIDSLRQRRLGAYLEDRLVGSSYS